MRGAVGTSEYQTTRYTSFDRIGEPQYWAPPKDDPDMDCKTSEHCTAHRTWQARDPCYQPAFTQFPDGTRDGFYYDDNGNIDRKVNRKFASEAS